MKETTDRLIQRTKTYWYSDGLTEIGYTFIFLVLAAYFYGQATLPPDSLLFRILDISFFLILILGILATRKLVIILKNKLTYPRTGYVRYRQPQPAQKLGSIAIAMIVSATILLMISFGSDNVEAYLPIISGILLGVVLLLIAYRSRILRFYLLGAISALLGSGLTLSGVGDILGLSYFYGLMGLIMLIIGLLVLRDYLMKTQPIEE